MRRIMGLDYGSRTIGVALSDPLRITAQGLETVTRKSETKLRQSLARLEAIIREYDVEFVVLGLPLNLNNEYGDRARRTEEFGEMLKRRTGLNVIMRDERLTSNQAHRVLSEAGLRTKEHKQYVDTMAAVLILQNYLDETNHEREIADHEG